MPRWVLICSCMSSPVTQERLWTRDFTIFCVSSLVMFFAFYSLVSALPVYLSEELHAENWEIGVVLSSYAFAALLLRPFCGYALDAWGRKWIFLIGFFIFSVLFAFHALPTCIFSEETRIFRRFGEGFGLALFCLIIIRFIHGLSWAIVTAGSQTITVDLVPTSRRGEGVAYTGLMVSLSMAVGPALGLTTLEALGGNKLFIISTVLSLISFAAVCFMKFPPYRPTRSKIRLQAMFEKTSVPISLVCMLTCFSNAPVMSYVAIYSKDLPGTNAGVFFFVYAVSITAIRVFTGKLFDRYGPRIPVCSAYPFLVLGAVLMGVAHGPGLFYTASVCLGFGSGIIYPCFVACINNMVRPTRRGAANATYSSAIDLGIGPGIVFFGVLSSYAGLRVTYFISAVLYAIAYGMYLLAEQHYLRHNLNKQSVFK